MKLVQKITVQALVDNWSDPISSKPEWAETETKVLMEEGMEVWASESMCTGHHGLSLVVTLEVDGNKRTLLFDGGPEAYAVERNGQALGIKFGDVEAVVLSHGHCDHSEGIPKAIDLIREKNGGRNVPLYVHPEAFVDRSIKHPGGYLPLQAVPTPEAFAAHGADLHVSSEAEEILDGLVYLSGEIPRHSFERGMPGHYKKDENGDWVEDPLVIDERFMAVHLEGKGLVVFTGCSHAGIINVLTEAQRLFPDIPLYGVVGGLHLVAPNEDLIPQTVQGMKDLGLQRIVSGHCTGWRGVFALVEAFGDEVVAPLSVGSRYTMA